MLFPCPLPAMDTKVITGFGGVAEEVCKKNEEG